MSAHALRSEDDDGGKNVAQNVNIMRSFNLHLDYSNSFISSSVGDLSESKFLGTIPKFRKRKKNLSPLV